MIESRRTRSGSAAGSAWRDALREDLFEAAEHHQVLLPLHDLLRRAEIPIPKSLADEAEQWRLAWKVKRKAYEELLGRVAEMAAEERVSFVLLKGPNLAERLYSDPEVRRFGDLDLLVAREGFFRLIGRLTRSGVVPTPSPYQVLCRQAILTWELPLTFSPAGSPGLHLDLHLNLTHRLEPYHLPVEPVWERVRPWKNGILELSDCDFLLFLMIQTLKHGRFDLRALLDLHQAAALAPLAGVFPAVQELAANAGFGTLVGTVCELGRRLLGTTWPAGATLSPRSRLAAKLLESRVLLGEPYFTERFQLLLSAILLVESPRRLARYLRLTLVRPPETVPDRPYRSGAWTNPWAGLVRLWRSRPGKPPQGSR